MHFVLLQGYIIISWWIYILWTIYHYFIIIRKELSHGVVTNKRAGGHVFNIFSANWVIKLPFLAESTTTFNLLFLVCMIVN